MAGELAASSSGSTSPNMEERFRALEKNTDVDDELERMKRLLPPVQREVKGQLPPIVYDAQVEDEYERMKRDLNRR